jgi:hypothetical protein
MAHPSYAEFVLQAAPAAHRELSNGFRSFVASQARALLGLAAASGAKSFSAPGQKRSVGGGGGGGAGMSNTDAPVFIPVGSPILPPLYILVRAHIPTH